MKKRYTNILLATAVLAIWFIIIKRVVSTLEGGDDFTPRSGAMAPQQNEILPAVGDSLFFKPIYVYHKNPFVDRGAYKAPINNAQIKQLTTVAETDKVDSIALYINEITASSKYFGLIKNKEQGKQLALVNIAGELQQVKVGDILKAKQLKVTSVSEQELGLTYQKRAFVLLKE